MIPRRIFYTWFGGEPPASVQMCLLNWQRTLAPEWEIVRIGAESSPYFDLQAELAQCRWLRAVYERGMWAYVSDYARCKVLHTHGGVYLDTDVTLEKDLSPLLNTPLFLGWESPEAVNMSICGAEPGHELLAAMLEFYAEEVWHSTLYTIPRILTDVLRTRLGLAKQYATEPQLHPRLSLYPADFFYPWTYGDAFSPACLTPRTYAIHWWGESWVNPAFNYFLLHKHLPGYDFARSTTRRSYTHYRLGSLRLLTIKEQQDIRRFYLLGFIPVLTITPDRTTLLGCISLNIKRKEKEILLCMK